MTDTIKSKGMITLFFRHAGFVFFFLIVFGVFAGVIGSSTLFDASEFSGRGKIATAEITGTTLREWRGPGTGNDSKIPFAIIHFSVNGEDVNASARISQSLFKTARPGDEVEIRYLPEDRPRSKSRRALT